MMVSTARADVTYAKVEDRDVIIISNTIKKGDSVEFNSIAAGLNTKPIVYLTSHGGYLVDGLTIGETIRAKGFPTVVVNDNLCASTCSLIWLAGTPRFAGERAQIGFHAAYTGAAEEVKESGVGNALVGAYLNRLKLSYDAVAFATSAPPDQLAWLHPAEAARAGIDYIVLADDPPPAPMSELTGQAGSAVEQRVRRLVMAYYAAWSGTGADVRFLARFYDDTVSFYGTNLPLKKLMMEKQKFSERWPTRKYSVKTDSLFVRCNDICAVSGVVEWDVSSAERGVRSTGAANFVLKISLTESPPGGLIVAENGAVLSSQKTPLGLVASGAVSVASTPATGFSISTGEMSPEQQAASNTQAYADGRQARINYEQWFAALLDGPYRDGVIYWAAHRGDKPAAACADAAGGAAWAAGCDATKAFLAPVDLRRRSDRNYWLGWNSL